MVQVASSLVAQNFEEKLKGFSDKTLNGEPMYRSFTSDTLNESHLEKYQRFSYAFANNRHAPLLVDLSMLNVYIVGNSLSSVCQGVEVQGDCSVLYNQ